MMTVTNVFTLEELENYDFDIIQDIGFLIDEKMYLCNTEQKIIDISTEDFDKYFTKDLIAAIILDEGFTHIFQVEKREFDESEFIPSLRNTTRIGVIGFKNNE